MDKLGLTTPNLLSFNHGLLSIDHHEENVPTDESVNIPEELRVFPSDKLLDPYSGTALDFKGHLADQTLKALAPKIDNDKLFLSDVFLMHMQSADENFRKLAKRTKNKNFNKAIHVLIEEMALRELLSNSRSALISV
ncbi:type III secretion apparatus assembly protein SctX [Candidatus Ichthyocystis hellenicum]|uniref:type III secretion apparatus assembly protein SctX n=1 Tax=Candidatus Ichthyocystis hellenicum TaxID=1561003 RepID=UPI000B83EF89|nr:hypothetical protein [Candidatus Ichthyocystis hellenicum]